MLQVGPFLSNALLATESLPRAKKQSCVSKRACFGQLAGSISWSHTLPASSRADFGCGADLVMFNDVLGCVLAWLARRRASRHLVAAWNPDVILIG